MTEAGGLPSRPRIPRYFHVVPMPNGNIQMKSAHKTVILSGGAVKAVGKLLGLLDGTRDVTQVVECFPDFPPEQVLRTLRRLFEKGLIEDASESGGDLRKSTPYEAQETFFSITYGNGRGAQGLLAGARVVVLGLGRVGSHAVALLARAGVGTITAVDDGTVDGSLPVCGGLYLPEDVGRARVEAAAERLVQLNPDGRFELAQIPASETAHVADIMRGANLALVCQDSPAVAVYRSVNEVALEQDVRWLRASLEGFEAQLGPCVVPRQTACHTCYELRARGNWSYYEENLAFEHYLSAGMPRADYGCLAPVSGCLGNLAALESLKLLTGFSPPITCGRVWTFNINTFEARTHEVLKLPRCPSCGLIKNNPTPALWAL